MLPGYARSRSFSAFSTRPFSMLEAFTIGFGIRAHSSPNSKCDRLTPHPSRASRVVGYFELVGVKPILPNCSPR